MTKQFSVVCRVGRVSQQVAVDDSGREYAQMSVSLESVLENENNRATLGDNGRITLDIVGVPADTWLAGQLATVQVNPQTPGLC